MEAEPRELTSGDDWSPLGRHLGIRLLDCGEERARMAVDVRPEVGNRQGGLHGGTVSALIDIVAGVAVLFGDGGGMRRNGTVSMTVQYLDVLREGTAIAEAVVIRRGRSLSICEVKVRGDADQLIATALVTYRIDS